MRKSGLFVGAALSAALIAGSAGAAIVTNGSFETNGGNGQVGYNTTVAGWTVAPEPNSYVFLWNAGGGGASGTTADNGGALGYEGTVSLWGPGTGSANGLTLSPDGGAFIGIDPVYDANPPAISQTLTGLTPGKQYTVSFDWAAAQQAGPNFTGGTDSGWTVDFGSSQSASTGTISIPGEGFSGWQTASFQFTADGTSDVLSFIADGGPSASLPPFALLDGVSVTVPEPATWALMLVGVGALGAGLRMRRRAVLAIA